MKIAILILVSVFLIDNRLSTNAQTASTISTTPDPLDASVGGKAGNPGAQLRFGSKALDSIYKHAVDMITRAILSMVIPDVIVPVGNGMLTIKSVRVTEAKFSNFYRDLMPPNRIRSRLTGGRMVSIGQWQYRPMEKAARQLAGGIFRVLVVNAEMNITNQLGRTWEAKAQVQTNECKAYLGQFRVEIEGFGDNTTVINQCDNLMCKRIRGYFEDAVCNTARNYIKDTLNQRLSTVPTRINLGPSGGNRFVLDYGLLQNEPKVTEKYIQAYMEGEVMSRGSQAASFYANELVSFDDNNQSTISFMLSDYTFNTLLHQAHVQQYRFSVYDHLPSKSPLKNQLKLQCASSRAHVPKGRGAPYGGRQLASSMCLGSIFENATAADSGSSEGDGLGDLVFKSQRPLQVIVQTLPLKSIFGVNGGTIEAYGAAGSDGKRELLGRADIQSMRGQFVPKLSECNITASINITDLQLIRSPPSQSRLAQLSDQMLARFAQLSTLLLNEMFNIFMNQYAQFPVPLVEGNICDKPQLRWMQRTMQIDADVRISPDATRGGKN